MKNKTIAFNPHANMGSLVYIVSQLPHRLSFWVGLIASQQEEKMSEVELYSTGEKNSFTNV